MKGAAGVLSCALALASCATDKPMQGDVERLEARLSEQMPSGAWPLQTYVRYYANTAYVSEDDLPFTTIAEPGIAPGERLLITGVLVQPGIWEERRPGIHLVSKDELPFAVHLGCRAVNVAYDPAAREIVGVWCNVEMPPPPPA